MAFPRQGAALEVGAARMSVSGECRTAALTFMAGVAGGWAKLDVARWLVGPYAHATRHCPRGQRMHSAEDVVVTPETLEVLLTCTRGRILAALETAALSNGALDFTDDAIDLRWVRRAAGEVWVPVDGARMRLRERVCSLFAADYLNDPISYGSLYVCHHCETVVFDEGARQIGACSAHRRISSIILKGDKRRDVPALVSECR